MTAESPIESLRKLRETTDPRRAEQVFRAEKAQHPAGWEPGVAMEGNFGSLIVSVPTPEPPKDWSDLLAIWDLDPEVFEVVEPVEYRAWDANLGRDAEGNACVQRFYYYKARVQRIGMVSPEVQDVAELIADVKRYKPRKPRSLTDETSAFVVALADWQLGKADGDGTLGSVERILSMIDSVEQRIRLLRKLGRKMGTCYIFGIGDLFENCDGHYDIQTFTVELDRRDQIKVGRRLLIEAIKRWSTYFERVVVSGVAGNHGENRKDGKAFTTLADNDDVAVFEQVHDALIENSAFDHVSFAIPDDRLEVVLDVAGVSLGIAHSHQAKTSGAMPQMKVWNWWKGQMAGRQPAGDADILITGHFHHFSCVEWGPRTHFQCPAMDGGSDWFRNMTGADGTPGTITMVVGQDVAARGWTDLEIVS